MAWSLEYLNADQGRPHIPAKARTANSHTPEPETAEDRIATQRKAKATSDKCGDN